MKRMLMGLCFLMALPLVATADTVTCPESDTQRKMALQNAEYRLDTALSHAGGQTGNYDYTHPEQNEQNIRKYYAEQCSEAELNRRNAELKDLEEANSQARVDELAKKAKILQASMAEQKEACNACFEKALDEHFKPFYKKHGRHLPDTDGYRTRIVVIYGEAERIPTDKQAKYDLLWEEHRSEFDDATAKSHCNETADACKQILEADKHIKSYSAEIKSILHTKNTIPDKRRDLESHVEHCQDVGKNLVTADEVKKEIATLKACKYAPKPTSPTSPTSPSSPSIPVALPMRLPFGL